MLILVNWEKNQFTHRKWTSRFFGLGGRRIDITNIERKSAKKKSSSRIHLSNQPSEMEAH